MAQDNLQDWLDWATGLTGADEGDLILSHDEVETIVDGAIGLLGTLHTDPSTLPAGATARPRGAFTDPNDLQHYLNGGGLLSYGEGGETFHSPLVHILKRVAQFDQNIIYEVWIDDQNY